MFGSFRVLAEALAGRSPSEEPSKQDLMWLAQNRQISNRYVAFFHHGMVAVVEVKRLAFKLWI